MFLREEYMDGHCEEMYCYSTTQVCPERLAYEFPLYEQNHYYQEFLKCTKKKYDYRCGVLPQAFKNTPINSNVFFDIVKEMT